MDFDTNIDKHLTREERIEIGMELSEWRKTKIGQLVEGVIRAKMIDTAFSITNESTHKDVIKFARTAGFVAALEWVLGDIQGRINAGKRMAAEDEALKKDSET